MQTRLYHQAAATFEAARRIDGLPSGHPAGGRHGHGFKARVMAELPLAWGGFVGAETDALAQALGEAVEPLSYADLNTRLPVPSDANLAAWVRQRLQAGGLPGIAQVGVQSTSEQGVELRSADSALAPAPAASLEAASGASLGAPAGASLGASTSPCQVHVWRRFRFEAAHRLTRVPAEHPCGRMHGHGFEVILHTEQPVLIEPDEHHRETPTSLDYDRIGALWAPLHETLDHSCLNDLPGLENPTSEWLAHWIWQRLKPRLPALALVSVYETATAGCHYDGQDYRIWKEMRFEAALRLTGAPDGDRRRRLHGHSYLLRLHLSAPLDQVLGWTIDYGDVKQLFKPVYARLDHHELNGLRGLADPSTAGVAGWIRAQIAEVLPAADRLELLERPGRGVLLCWGQRRPWQGRAVLPLST